MIFPLDPEAKIRNNDRLYLTRILGRTPTEADMDAYYAQQRRKLDAERRAREKEEKERQEQEEIAAETKSKSLASRAAARTRNQSPPEPVFNSLALRQRAENDEPCCQGSRIMGEENQFTEIDLDLDLFDFQGSSFKNVNFVRNAQLCGCDFSGSKLENVYFGGGVNVTEADFSNCELKNVTFDYNCKISGASFRFAKFRRGVKIQVDRNHLATTIFDERRTDEWAKMAKSFSGIWQYINLTLGGLYMMILIIKLYAFNFIVEWSAALLGKDTSNQSEFVSISTFEFLFGSSVWSIILALLILTYQGLRLFLTVSIGPMIDYEVRSGYTPERSAYLPLIRATKILRILGWVALLLFVFELWTLAVSGPLVLPALHTHIIQAN